MSLSSTVVWFGNSQARLAITTGCISCSNVMHWTIAIEFIHFVTARPDKMILRYQMVESHRVKQCMQRPFKFSLFSIRVIRHLPTRTENQTVSVILTNWYATVRNDSRKQGEKISKFDFLYFYSHFWFFDGFRFSWADGWTQINNYFPTPKSFFSSYWYLLLARTVFIMVSVHSYRKGCIESQ